jgi:hypothetical protein
MPGVPVEAKISPVGESAEPGAGTQRPAAEDAPSAKCGTRGPRKLAVVHSYYDLVDAFRARVLELGTDFEEIDRVAGYADTYTSKLLSPRPIRNFGEVSLGSMLGALGLVLTVEEDTPAAAAKARARLKQRVFASVTTQPKNAPVTFRLSRAFFRKISKKAAAARMQKVSPERRREIARNASLKRWHKPRIVEITPASGEPPAE